MIWTVYILKCSDGKYYTGCTSNLKERIKTHKMGKVRSTKNRLPVEQIIHISFSDRYKAYQFEKYLKSGSGTTFRNKSLI